jgi:hypothetical protein
MGAYDQFIWFGDSLTQQGWNQEAGFAAGAAVQDGEFWVSVLGLCLICWCGLSGCFNTLEDLE